ncbi:MAG: hypothetical protein ACFCU5_16340 [Pleurocapsa sp.]
MKNFPLFIASCFFLVGSAIFTLEATLEIIRATSFFSFAHFLACLFFTFGSWLFLQDARN